MIEKKSINKSNANMLLLLGHWIPKSY